MTEPALSDHLAAFLGAGAAVIMIDITAASGSAPRGVGAAMLVTADAIQGTIGGGALEDQAIRAAREMLAMDETERSIDQPLGPEIGQCCGGRVALRLRRATRAVMAEQAAIDQARCAARPHVLIFGAGHTGGALARALAPLPLSLTIIDQRAEWLAPLSELGRIVETALPEAEAGAAPPGSAFAIMTHDHALDFLIAEAALVRNDAAYVGLIGSASKRAAFTGALARKGLAADGLTCPIGAGGPAGKHPAIIAAATAAEIAAALL